MFPSGLETQAERLPCGQVRPSPVEIPWFPDFPVWALRPCFVFSHRTGACSLCFMCSQVDEAVRTFNAIELERFKAQVFQPKHLK